MKKLLLYILTLVCLSSLPSHAQSKVYRLTIMTAYKDGEAVNKGSVGGDACVINERDEKIELLSSNGGYQDRIFRINNVVEEGDHTKMYTCKMPATGGGYATVFIYVDTFFRQIKVVGMENNPVGIKNYLEYQYK